MKTMKLVGSVAVGLMLVLTAGCGKSKALTSAEEYQATTCACKDTACVTAAATKFAAGAGDMATAKTSEADAISKATTDAAQCAAKVAMASIPGMPAMPGPAKK